MSEFAKITVPAGDAIQSVNGRLEVPDRPIIGFIRGDGVGPDITAAAMHIWNSAMKQSKRFTCRNVAFLH